jgi:cytochrome c oxidase accessory protein FixG
LTLVLPFITIDGNHILLLSFDKLQFHFFGTAYNMDELYIMPFLIMFLFVGIFMVTTMLGRFWCGWACPQTIFRVIYRDLIEGTLLDLRKISNKQKDIDNSKLSVVLRRYIAIVLWVILSLIIATNFTWYFIPPEDFFAYLQEPMEHMFMIGFILSLAGFLLFDIIYIKEKFCVYICPYSRVQSVFYDDNTTQVIYDSNRGGDVYQDGKKSITSINSWSQNEECTTCEACVKVCPTGIDIRKGLQLECINCLECSDACSSVMQKLGKSSLIEWGSTNIVLKSKPSPIINTKSIMYSVVLIASLVLAIFFASQKESLLVHINRTTNLYSIKQDSITNNYLVTIHNKATQAYNYDIALSDNKNFEIVRFKNIYLKPNKLTKTVLIIGTKHKIDTKDTSIKLKIELFAKENPKVRNTQDIVFIYPQSDLR